MFYIYTFLYILGLLLIAMGASCSVEITNHTPFTVFYDLETVRKRRRIGNGALGAYESAWFSQPDSRSYITLGFESRSQHICRSYDIEYTNSEFDIYYQQDGSDIIFQVYCNVDETWTECRHSLFVLFASYFCGPNAISLNQDVARMIEDIRGGHQLQIQQ